MIILILSLLRITIFPKTLTLIDDVPLSKKENEISDKKLEIRN
jgi:hypothetical protein